MTNDPQTAFSRPFSVDELKTESKMDIEADAAERKALSAQLGVASLDRLAGNLLLTREIGAIIHLHGTVDVELTQACVVTLKPLISTRSLVIDRRFGPPEVVEEEDQDEDVAFDENDPPDVNEDGIIDVGEAIVEQLALEIDPFPRADGAKFEGYSSGPAEVEEVKSPFAVLEELVKKPK
ncbi:MAG: DUF177 domain-containing protein [Rhodospirillales bacterium]|nr:DUF177 domain-containing protein [Rhodospirillales bacterium]